MHLVLTLSHNLGGYMHIDIAAWSSRVRNTETASPLAGVKLCTFDPLQTLQWQVPRALGCLNMDIVMLD